MATPPGGPRTSEILTFLSGKGLPHTDQSIQDCLETGRYAPILREIRTKWSYRKRLNWLRLHRETLHVPLLFELAVEELTVALETALRGRRSPLAERDFRQVSDALAQDIVPTFVVAAMRMEQDALTLGDKRIIAVAREIEKIYIHLLDGLLKRVTERCLDQFPIQEDVLRSSVKKAVIGDMTRSKTLSLPDPWWIYYRAGDEGRRRLSGEERERIAAEQRIFADKVIAYVRSPAFDHRKAKGE